MLLKTFILILVLQNAVFSSSMRLTHISKDDILKAYEDDLVKSLNDINKDNDDILPMKNHRRFGSWLSEFLPSATKEEEVAGAPKEEEDKETTTTETTDLDRSMPEVTLEELRDYLRGGYDMYERVVNDKDKMDFLTGLYNKDYDGWLQLLNSKDVQDWLNSLYDKIEDALVNHIVTNPLLSPLRSALNVLSPIYGGDPTHAMVSSVVSGVLRG